MIYICPNQKSTAKATISVGPENFRLIKATNEIKKGDVLSVDKLACIMGAKKTLDLIPLCHPLALTKNVKCYLEEYEFKIIVECQAQCISKTGVEMEALTGASVAALTVYDVQGC